MNVKISEVINTKFAVTTDNGTIVFNLINKELSEGNNVSIDFSDIITMTTAFLNSAIGQLYSKEDYTSEFLNKHLKIEGLKKSHLPLLKMVIERAKEYFADKETFEKNLDESINGN